MSQVTPHKATEFLIGANVVGGDGALGSLTRVVMDPIARTITHLVVEPQRPPGTGYLVPVEHVSSARGNEIKLQCTATAFSGFEKAREVHFIRGGSGGSQQVQMLSLPHYQAATGATVTGFDPAAMGSGPHPVITERIPSGEIDVRRGESVQATDGALGLVLGMLVDPSDYSVTHILLHEGHLRTERRVAIPIAAVIGVENGVRLSLSKKQVQDLPALIVADPC